MSERKDNEDYQETAVFFRKASTVDDLQTQNEANHLDSFTVEKIVMLSDEDYQEYKEHGFLRDQIFLFDNLDKMWFEPGEQCWHCLLIKGETSRDGILVESEGYTYTRYSAFIPDCNRLRTQEIPIQYEPPLRDPEHVQGEKRKEQKAR